MTPMNRTCPSALTALVLFLLLAESGGSAHAATRTWKGGSSSNWSTAANWVENQAPVNGDRLVFAGTGATFATNDIPNLELVDWVISPGVDYIIQGEAVTLTSLTPLSLPGMTGSVSLRTPLRLPPSARIAASSANDAGLALGEIRLAGGKLTIQAPGTRLFLQGSITEIAPSDVSITARSVEIGGLNAFSGQLDIVAESIRALGAASLGTAAGKTRVSGASGPLEVASSVAEAVAESFVLSGTGPDAGITVGELTGSLEITGTQATHGNTFRGPITGSGRLVATQSPFTAITLYNPGNSFTGGLELNESRLALGAAEVVPDASELVVGSQNSVLELGPYTETVRRLDCAEGAIKWQPGALLRVLEPSHVGTCSFQLVFPTNYTPPAEIVLVRNESGKAIDGMFGDLQQGRSVSINGSTRFATYVGGTTGRDFALVMSSGISTIAPVSFPPTALRAGQVIPSAGTFRVANAGNAPMANALVRATAEGGCGVFAGGASSLDLRSNSEGLVVLPAFTALAFDQNCAVSVTGIPDGGFSGVGFTIYEPETIRLVMRDPFVSVAPGVELRLIAGTYAGGTAGLPPKDTGNLDGVFLGLSADSWGAPSGGTLGSLDIPSFCPKAQGGHPRC